MSTAWIAFLTYIAGLRLLEVYLLTLNGLLWAMTSLMILGHSQHHYDCCHLS